MEHINVILSPPTRKLSGGVPRVPTHYSIGKEKLNMATALSKVVLVLAVSALGLAAADNSIGTWKRNLAKTDYSQGTTPNNPIVDQTVVIEPVEGGVKVTSTGKRKDGTPINTTSVRKYDGKFHPVSGSGTLFDASSVKQVDANNFTSESKKTGGKYHTSGTMTISPDGKTMTLKQKGTNEEGKPINFTVVYDKQ
jgi:hypothetical protein